MAQYLEKWCKIPIEEIPDVIRRSDKIKFSYKPSPTDPVLDLSGKFKHFEEVRSSKASPSGYDDLITKKIPSIFVSKLPPCQGNSADGSRSCCHPKLIEIAQLLIG